MKDALVALRNLLNLSKCMKCWGSVAWLSAIEAGDRGLGVFAAMGGMFVPLKTTSPCI